MNTTVYGDTQKHTFYGRVNIKLEKAKIAFQFLIMAVCSLIIGCIWASALSDEFYFLSVESLSSHFEDIFANCSDIYERILCVVNFSFSDIFSIVIIFVVSFASFNYVATDLVLLYCGVRCGLNVSFLFNFITEGRFQYSVGVLRYCVFFFFKIAILALMLSYAYRVAVCSMDMKFIGSDGRMTVRYSRVMMLTLFTVANIGSVLLLNGLYCWLIFILK